VAIVASGGGVAAFFPLERDVGDVARLVAFLAVLVAVILVLPFVFARDERALVTMKAQPEAHCKAIRGRFAEFLEVPDEQVRRPPASP
jgi:hypothetical protein